MRSPRRTAAMLFPLAAFLLFLVVRPFTGARPGAGDTRNAPSDGAGPGVPAGMSGLASGTSASSNRRPAFARGVVRNGAKDIPVAKATLTVTRESVVVAETVTDDAGTFVLPCGEDDEVEVRATGFVSIDGALQCKDGLRYLLDPGVQLEGQVLTPKGAPADGALVACHRGDWTRSYLETAADADGRFSLVCETGDLRLSAHHASGAPVWETIGSLPGGTIKPGVVLRLKSGRRLTGHLLTAAGEPRKGQVLAMSGNDKAHASIVATDDAGAFGVSLGFTEYVVTGASYDGRMAATVIPAGQGVLSPIELRFPAGETLRGRLVGDSLHAVVHADRGGDDAWKRDALEVRDSAALLLLNGNRQRVVEAKGDRFVIDDIGPGEYGFWAHGANAEGRAQGSTGAGEIVIVMDPIANLDLSVRRADGSTIDGRVDLNEAVASRSTLLEDGEASVSALKPGEYELRLQPTEGPVPSPYRVRIVPGPNEVTWTLPATWYKVSGRVIDAATKAPVASAQITSTALIANEWFRQGPFVQTDDSGNFSMDVATAETWIFVYRGGYQSKAILAADATTVLLAAGEASDVVKNR